MTTPDMLATTSRSSFETSESLTEKAALERLFLEVRNPEIDEQTLREIAHEVAQFADVALPAEMRELFNDFYEPRALKEQSGEGTRYDFATREFDHELGAPGAQLDGWFTMIESLDGTLCRYAFAAPDRFDYEAPGRLIPVAVTVGPEGDVTCSTIAYKKGHGVEVPIRSDLNTYYLEQAFYDIFLASQRMQQRGSDERDSANADALARLSRHKRELISEQTSWRQLRDIVEDEVHYTRPEATEGVSWVIPERWSY